MGFCSCSVKYLLFFFNFLVVLCGTALIVLGVFANSKFSPLKEEVDGAVTASITLIVLGVIIFIIAFFGCCGAIRESSCMVTTYAVILLFILIIEIVLGVLAFLLKEEIESSYKTMWEQKFENYNADEEQRKEIDDVQQFYECCGPHGPTSWENGKWPESCCKEKDVNPSACVPFQAGCIEKTSQFLISTLNNFGGAIIGLGCIQVLGVIFACFLASSIRNQERRGYV